MQARLTRGPVGWTLWRLSWPMTMGLFSIIAFNIVDTFYIGMLGADQLAAIGFCFPVIFFMGAFAIGLGFGAQSVVSRAIGEGNMPRARRLTANTMTLVIGYSLFMTVLMQVISDPIFRLLGTPDALMPYVNQYMDVWYRGLIFLVSPIVANSLIRANGEALIPSIMMVVAAFINAVISPVLVFGWLGFPELGMAGAAWATIAARFTIVVAAVYYLGFHEKVMEVSWRSVQALPRHVGSILRFSVPATIAQLVSPLATAAIVRMLAEYGQDAVAGFTVGSRIETLMLIPFFALQQGVGPFIGQNVGANKPERLEQAERWIWRFAVFWGVLAMIVLACFGGDIGRLFSDHQAIIARTDQFLMLTGIGFVFAGLFYAGLGVLNPLGHPNLAAMMSAVRFLIVYVGAAYVLSRGLIPGIDGPTGVFVAAPLSWLIAGALAAWLINSRLPHGTKEGPEGERTSARA